MRQNNIIRNEKKNKDTSLPNTIKQIQTQLPLVKSLQSNKTEKREIKENTYIKFIITKRGRMNKGHKILKSSGADIAYELTWIEDDLASSYMNDMKIAQEFAFKNRLAILDEIIDGMRWKCEESINCVHNYVDVSSETYVMRKGAISAKKGERVIIPINMRDGIILGIGLGNSDWNESAPHGAGRLMSREQVRNSFTVSQFKKEMKGIYCESIGKDTLDEAPFAYKGINDILPILKETVDVTKVIKPIYNFKAGGDD